MSNSKIDKTNGMCFQKIKNATYIKTIICRIFRSFLKCTLNNRLYYKNKGHERPLADPLTLFGVKGIATARGAVEGRVPVPKAERRPRQVQRQRALEAGAFAAHGLPGEAEVRGHRHEVSSGAYRAHAEYAAVQYPYGVEELAAVSVDPLIQSVERNRLRLRAAAEVGL